MTMTRRASPRASAFPFTAVMASELRNCFRKRTRISTQKRQNGKSALPPRPIPAVVPLKPKPLQLSTYFCGRGGWYYIFVSQLLLSDGIAVGIHDVHRSEVQFANSGLDLCKVPDHHPDQSIREFAN